jgi:predicted transcriptional regulator
MEQVEQKEQIKNEFLTIAREVSEEDRLRAALEFGCSYATVSRYLRGEVSKERFAKKLLVFLKNRIEQAA